MTAGPSYGPQRNPRTVIVIVDDEQANLDGLSSFCSRRGFEPHAFTDAQEALAAIRGGLHPELVITDYRMPGMDGLQFVEALRSLRFAAPIIVLTAHGNIDSYFSFFSLGVYDFVHKPVRDAELERIIRASLRYRGSAKQNLRSGGS